jgi:hypothetical protein
MRYSSLPLIMKERGYRYSTEKQASIIQEEADCS